MSVEAKRETVIEVWPEWHGAVINGVYPLRRMLHGSDHSAVFLTEANSQGTPDAAIKILRTEGVLTDLQLRQWKTAAALSHPRLIRLLDSGRCELGGRQCLFVVMEYAEQTLAQVLPHRGLTSDEVQEMLLPTLQALGFLHRKNLVQGQLKPANFLVVNDQLKLASDTIRTAGEPRPSIVRSTVYDAPEANHGRLSPAADIWSLGVTLVEALTQSLPWSDDHSGTPCLPATLPSAFVDTIQRCLSPDPANRPTATDLEARFKRAPQAPVVVSVPQAVGREAPPRAAPTQESSQRHSTAPPIVLAALLMLLLGTWAGWRIFHRQPDSRPPAPSAAQSSLGAPVVTLQNPKTLLPTPPQGSGASANAKSQESKPLRPRPVSTRTEQVAPRSANASPYVIHEEIPVVPRSALRTIRGHIKVAVLVMVDRSGNVIDALLENPGPSSYFARFARDAAGKWKFAPADEQDPRKWVLRFEFTSSGTTAHAAAR